MRGASQQSSMFPKTCTDFMPKHTPSVHAKRSTHQPNKILVNREASMQEIAQKQLNHFFTLEAPHRNDSPDNKKVNRSIEYSYQIKKNAYRKYIKEIYSRINQELRKKNSFLNIASQAPTLDYGQALTTKEVRPAVRIEDDRKDHQQIQERIREKLKLEKLQKDSASLEKLKKKIISFRKDKEAEGMRQALLEQEMIRKRQESQESTARQSDVQKKKPKSYSTIPADDGNVKKRQPEIRMRKKERTYSLNSTAVVGPKSSIEDFVPVRKAATRKDPFVFGMGDKASVQEKNKEKILSYIDFLWKVNYSNGLYVKPTPEQTVYKAYVGPGNNSLMIKSILKRRYWWNIVQKPDQNCNFVWTQLKLNSFSRDSQKSSQTRRKDFYHVSEDGIKEVMLGQFDDNGQNPHSKLFNLVDYYHWIDHSMKNKKTEVAVTEKTYLKRNILVNRKNLKRIEDSRKIAMHNHVPANYSIGNKKALFYHMKKYYELMGKDVFTALPLTFHIVKGVNDPQYRAFLDYYEKVEAHRREGSDDKNMWILKPGEFSNRGNGISVCHFLDEINVRLKSKERSSDGALRTFIIQKYLQKPLLYKSRKFDIRHYMLLTCFNGVFKAYWFPQGYLRTSSSQFTLKRGANQYVHLTNDAIQQRGEEYGKYEKGNKISYQKFQQYLDKTLRKKIYRNIFYDSILPQMKELAIHAVRATYLSLDQKRLEHNFQLLGMDFMIDQSLKPWLIEINTNPCLDMSCPLLARLIPSLIENTFRICVDPFFPPPEEWSTSKKLFIGDNALQQNRYELIFDETVHGGQLQALFKGRHGLEDNIGKVEEDTEVYEDDGVEEWEQLK